MNNPGSGVLKHTPVLFRAVCLELRRTHFNVTIFVFPWRRPPVTRLLRHSSALAIALVCFSIIASADLKIKTRTTVMGHSTESTVYIKGGRQRTETSFGGHGGSGSIIQCDQKRMITITGNQCMVIPMGGGESSCPATPAMGARSEEHTSELQ